MALEIDVLLKKENDTIHRGSGKKGFRTAGYVYRVLYGRCHHVSNLRVLTIQSMGNMHDYGGATL
jgi:hypothetical protein